MAGIMASLMWRIIIYTIHTESECCGQGYRKIGLQDNWLGWHKQDYQCRLLHREAKPIKKKKELEVRRQVLGNSIQNKLDVDQIFKNAEKYRDTRLLYNKAILHVIREKEWQENAHSYNKNKILKEIETWAEKSVEEIIDEVKQGLKINWVKRTKPWQRPAYNKFYNHLYIFIYKANAVGIKSNFLI